MFKIKKQDTPPTPLEEELTKLYSELKKTDALAASYESILAKIERLEALKPPVKEKKRISPDALIGAGANLLGIFSILGYEKANVVTSKAMSHVFKPRL